MATRLRDYRGRFVSSGGRKSSGGKGVRIVDRDRGWKRIKRGMRGADDVHMVVGVFGDKAKARHGDDEPTVGEIAVINEMGATIPTAGGGEIEIPARPALRGTVDENASRYRTSLRKVGQGVVAGRTDARTGLSLVGLQIEGDVKKRIADGVPPPNAQSTIDKKGSSTPLVERGQLRNSYGNEVRQGGLR